MSTNSKQVSQSDYNSNRRTFLKGVGAAGATAAVGTGSVAAQESDTEGFYDKTAVEVSKDIISFGYEVGVGSITSGLVGGPAGAIVYNIALQEGAIDPGAFYDVIFGGEEDPLPYGVWTHHREIGNMLILSDSVERIQSEMQGLVGSQRGKIYSAIKSEGGKLYNDTENYPSLSGVTAETKARKDDLIGNFETSVVNRISNVGFTLWNLNNILLDDTISLNLADMFNIPESDIMSTANSTDDYQLVFNRRSFEYSDVGGNTVDAVDISPQVVANDSHPNYSQGDTEDFSVFDYRGQGYDRTQASLQIETPDAVDYSNQVGTEGESVQDVLDETDTSTQNVYDITTSIDWTLVDDYVADTDTFVDTFINTLESEYQRGDVPVQDLLNENDLVNLSVQGAAETGRSVYGMALANRMGWDTADLTKTQKIEYEEMYEEEDLSTTYTGFSDSVNAMDFDSNNNILWVSTSGGASNYFVYGIDYETKEIIYQHSEHTSMIGDISYDPNNNIVWSCSAADENSVYGWSVDSQSIEYNFPSQQGISCYTIEYDSTNNIVWVGGNSQVSGWDPSQAAVVYSHTLHSSSVRSLEFIPSRNSIVSGGFDGNVYEWDIETQSQINTHSNHSSTVSSISYDSNNNILYSGSDNLVGYNLTSASVTLNSTPTGSNSITSLDYDSNNNIVWLTSTQTRVTIGYDPVKDTQAYSHSVNLANSQSILYATSTNSVFSGSSFETNTEIEIIEKTVNDVSFNYELVDGFARNPDTGELYYKDAVQYEGFIFLNNYTANFRDIFGDNISAGDSYHSFVDTVTFSDSTELSTNNQPYIMYDEISDGESSSQFKEVTGRFTFIEFINQETGETEDTASTASNDSRNYSSDDISNLQSQFDAYQEEINNLKEDLEREANNDGIDLSGFSGFGQSLIRSIAIGGGILVAIYALFSNLGGN